jgi:hypothetical protein
VLHEDLDLKVIKIHAMFEHLFKQIFYHLIAVPEFRAEHFQLELQGFTLEEFAEGQRGGGFSL